MSLRAFCLTLALSTISAWSAAPLVLRRGADSSAVRRAAVVRAETPIKSDDEFDYFRRQKEVAVALTKPLGAVLEPTSPGGVRVEELQDGGSAAATKLLKKNDRLLTVMGEDVSMSDLDSVMELLVGAPEEVELTVQRNVIVKKKRVVLPDPVLTIKGGPTGDVARGSSLRLTMQSAGVELYTGMAKLTNCGGAGQCSQCMVDVIEGGENLSPRTAVEEARLKKKPPTYRMACQTLIEGDVTVEVPTK